MMLDADHYVFLCDRCGKLCNTDEELHDIGDGRDYCEACFCHLVGADDQEADES